MRMRRSSIVVLIIAALAVMDAAVMGQSKDAFIGTWLLDRSKSDFEPPTPFQRRTLTIQESEGGLTYTTRTLSDRLQASESGRTELQQHPGVLQTVDGRTIWMDAVLRRTPTE